MGAQTQTHIVPHGWIENPIQNLHDEVYSSFIHNQQTFWKQPRRPSVSKWINKLWSMQTM